MRNASVALALTLGCAFPANAQIYEAVGTRAQGMGGAFIAVADDATASWWNPAGLATGKLFSLVVDRGSIADPAVAPAAGPARRDTATGFSAAFPAMAISYYRLRVSEIAPVSSTGTNEPGREDLGSGEVRLRALAVSQYGVTVGQSMNNHIILGSTLKLLRAGVTESLVVDGADLLDRTDDLEVSGETKTDLDVGVMAAFGHVRLGLAVKHLRAPEFGEGEDRFVMKRQARAGVAFLAQTSGAVNAVIIAADMDLTRTPTVNGEERRLAAGIETWLGNRWVGARTGVSVNTIGPRNATGSVGVSLKGPSGLFVDAALLFGADQARKGLNVGASMTF
jgi:hypothetical protein